MERGRGGRAGVDAHSQQEAVKEARPPRPSPSPTGHLQGAEAQGGQVPAQERDGCPISPSAPCWALSSAMRGSQMKARRQEVGCPSHRRYQEGTRPPAGPSPKASFPAGCSGPQLHTRAGCTAREQGRFRDKT